MLLSKMPPMLSSRGIYTMQYSQICHDTLAPIFIVSLSSKSTRFSPKATALSYAKCGPHPLLAFLESDRDSVLNMIPCVCATLKLRSWGLCGCRVDNYGIIGFYRPKGLPLLSWSLQFSRSSMAVCSNHDPSYLFDLPTIISMEHKTESPAALLNQQSHSFTICRHAMLTHQYFRLSPPCQCFNTKLVDGCRSCPSIFKQSIGPTSRVSLIDLKW